MKRNRQEMWLETAVGHQNTLHLRDACGNSERTRQRKQDSDSLLDNHHKHHPPDIMAWPSREQRQAASLDAPTYHVTHVWNPSASRRKAQLNLEDEQGSRKPNADPADLLASRGHIPSWSRAKMRSQTPDCRGAASGCEEYD